MQPLTQLIIAFCQTDWGAGYVVPSLRYVIQLYLTYYFVDQIYWNCLLFLNTYLILIHWSDYLIDFYNLLSFICSL